MSLCVPPYMPGYPGSIPAWKGYVHPYVPGIYAVWASCLYPCCLLAGMVYATSAVPVTFVIAVMYAAPETAAIPCISIYKCMPITMPEVPDIYAYFMLLLLLLLFIGLQGCCYSFLCMPIVISATIGIYAYFMLFLLLLLHDVKNNNYIPYPGQMPNALTVWMPYLYAWRPASPYMKKHVYPSIY